VNKLTDIQTICLLIGVLAGLVFFYKLAVFLGSLED
jgi:hypothetical protein